MLKKKKRCKIADICLNVERTTLLVILYIEKDIIEIE